MLTESQIERSISWLLKNASVPVRYLTRRYILEEDIFSPQMLDLWKQVQLDAFVQKTFAKRDKQTGLWYGWVGRMHPSATHPKYVATIWQLLRLGEMGFDISDPRIKKACEFALEFQFESGGFRRSRGGVLSSDLKIQGAWVTYSVDPCDTSNYLRGLASVGMGYDPRVKKGFKSLVETQREDGGWVRDSCIRKFGWTRSCPPPTHNAAVAFYYSGLTEYKPNLLRALNWLVWHLSTKEPYEIRRFLYRGHNMVRELLMFSENEIDMTQRPIQILLDWLMTTYDKDEGVFKYKGKPASKYRASDGKPPSKPGGISSKDASYFLKHVMKKDWLTYYMTRIFKNLS